MSITCRRQDQGRFADLGFHVEFEEAPNSPLLEMVDPEANYAHYEKLPTDIPFLGWHEAGDNYGEGKVVCDGKHHTHVGANHDGFVVAWNYRSARPFPKSIQQIRQYLKIERRVEQWFKPLRKT